MEIEGVADLAGRLTGLAYTHHGTPPTALRSFAWTYDAAGRIVGHASDIASEDVADNGYAYAAAGQLTAADYADGGRTDEAYTYDDNGNRVTANGSSYTTGDNNQLLADGTYRYLYDGEGGRTARYVDADASGTLNAGDTDVTEYTWDHRHRLTEVAHRAAFGEAVDWTAGYAYDVFNRRVASLYDTDGDGTADRVERYVWNGKNAALDFVDPDGGNNGEFSAPLAPAARYLWGPAVDQLLAQEAVDDGGPEDVSWPVTDNLGSVRSLVDAAGAVTATYRYDTFGAVTVLAGALSDSRYLYTGQEYDLITGDYYYDARWYDPQTGKFVNEDPKQSDPNLYRYCGNTPTNATDPEGLRTVQSYIKVGNAKLRYMWQEHYSLTTDGYYDPASAKLISAKGQYQNLGTYWVMVASLKGEPQYDPDGVYRFTNLSHDTRSGDGALMAGVKDGIAVRYKTPDELPSDAVETKGDKTRCVQCVTYLTTVDYKEAQNWVLDACINEILGKIPGGVIARKVMSKIAAHYLKELRYAGTSKALMLTTICTDGKVAEGALGMDSGEFGLVGMAVPYIVRDKNGNPLYYQKIWSQFGSGSVVLDSSLRASASTAYNFKAYYNETGGQPEYTGQVFPQQNIGSSPPWKGT